MQTKHGARIFSTLFVLASLVWSPGASGQGLVAPTAGPINSAMAGASTAAPVDFGSSYWNPAAISGLERQEVLLSSALVIPSIHLNTFLPANSVGGVFPPTDRSGRARSDSGVPSGLATGLSFRLRDDSPWTLGLGVFGLVGGSVNYAGNNSVPLLSSRQPPNTFGFGPIFANTSLLAITPMASYQATDRLAIGGGPIVTSGTATFNPAFFAPGPKGSLGFPTFPSATNSRPFWGGGFQLGLLYYLSENWNVGFSYKSPIWQERWGYNASNPDLSARRIGVQAQIPAIYSWGIAYKGFPKTLIDVDLRYFDYADASLFGQKVVDGGLGWRSVFAVAVGGQYKLSERITLRAGYLYNTNPIPSTATLFNVQAPGITTNTLSLGASTKLTEDITATVAWVHGFRNEISGGIVQVPGATARFDVQSDAIWLGLNVQFGKSRKLGPTPSSEESYRIPASPPVATAAASPPSPPSDNVVVPASAEVPSSVPDSPR
jgi:long-chain fatty acid transport protein